MSSTPIQKKVFFLMKNTVQNYAWGSKTSFYELFSISNPHREPQAELWMGAHTNGCSTITTETGEELLLSDFISAAPDEVLSSRVSEKFSELPFLFKVLAAESALSIQVHPSKFEAEEGYDKENAAGIPIRSFERNYKDPNHKPELVYALSHYKAMNGFRAFEEISSLLERVDCYLVKKLSNEFTRDLSKVGLQRLFEGILSLSGEERRQSIQQLLLAAEHHSDDIAFSTVLELSTQYPEDVGLFAPLMLNIITLEPGQAMYLDAKTPHAYINGTGLEVMANSDNVLRAGLTGKHIDVEELVKCTEFKHKAIESLILEPIFTENELYYQVPVEDFSFSLYLETNKKAIFAESAEILLPLDGILELSHANGEILRVEKGKSVFVPAYAKSYKITSSGRVARVYC